MSGKGLLGEKLKSGVGMNCKVHPVFRLLKKEHMFSETGSYQFFIYLLIYVCVCVKLELQLVVSQPTWVLRTEFGSSERAACVLNF